MKDEIIQRGNLRTKFTNKGIKIYRSGDEQVIWNPNFYKLIQDEEELSKLIGELMSYREMYWLPKSSSRLPRDVLCKKCGQVIVLDTDSNKTTKDLECGGSKESGLCRSCEAEIVKNFLKHKGITVTGL